jgi:hypothetical protein
MKSRDNPKRIRIVTTRAGRFDEGYEHRVYSDWFFGRGLEGLCPIPTDEVMTPTVAQSSIGRAIMDNVAYLKKNHFEKSTTSRLRLSEKGYVAK